MSVIYKLIPQLTHEALAGSHITEVCQELYDLVIGRPEKEASVKFNGIQITMKRLED